MKDNKSILILGAAGFIGSHTTDLLLSLGYRVIGVDNFRTGKIENLTDALEYDNFVFHEMDITNEHEMYGLFAENDIKAVYNGAAMVSVPESFDNPEDNAKINLYATDTIARLCIYFKVPRMVFASSASVYAGIISRLPYDERVTVPLSPYAAAKQASEIMLLGYHKSHNLNVICYRYFNVYGPRQRADSPYSGVLSIFTKNYKENKPIIVYGDGKQVRDFIHVSDIANFNAQALIRENITPGVYNACTGKTTSLNEIILILKDLFPDSMEPYYRSWRIGDPEYSCGDHRLLKNTMGLVAKKPFTTGILSLIK